VIGNDVPVRDELDCLVVTVVDFAVVANPVAVVTAE
jgi:hypothetical protein